MNNTIFVKRVFILLFFCCLIMTLLPSLVLGVPTRVDTMSDAQTSNLEEKTSDDQAMLLTNDIGLETLSAKEINLIIDKEQIQLSDPIKNIEGRTYYPFRACLESMGAVVNWQESSQTATGTLGQQSVMFTVGTSNYAVNGQANQMQDATTFLDQEINRVYIPIRYAAEALDYDVEWITGDQFDTISLTAKAPTAVISQSNTIALNERIVSLGQAKDQVINNFGKPSRIDASAFGFQWYIYNRQYESFIMIAIKQDKVVGFFSNAKNLMLKSNIGQGSIKADVDKAYPISNTMEFWYDPNNDNKLYAVYCMQNKLSDKDVEVNFLNNQELLLRTYEQECIDITNAFRANYYKPMVSYSAEAAKVALSHAKDMAQRNFFDHVNPDGQGPLDRMLAKGLDVQKITENCAGGYPNAIEVLKGWVDSASHRDGMLEDNDLLGVGAYYKQDSKYQYYLVQNFITPWN